MGQEKLSIQEWAAEERPREKFLKSGSTSLGNAELLAILLRSGNREKNAVDLARIILHKANNNLHNLEKFTFSDLSSINGIGEGKALSIMASFELARRLALEEVPEQAPIYSSEDAAKSMIPILKNLTHEECWIIYLNRSNKMIAKEKITSGGTNSTIVDIKIIIKSAIEKLASSIILIHNHPSGNPLPGEIDKNQTKRLQRAADTCDLILTDHIIIAGGRYFSFLDEGLL